MQNQMLRDTDVPDRSEGTGLFHIGALLWSRALLIVLCGLIGSFVMVLEGLFSEPDYTVRMLIMPPPDGGAAGLMSQIGSLASAASSLTGLRIPTADNPNFTAVIQLLNSPRVYAEMERRYHILPLFYPKRWDSEHGSWIDDETVGSTIYAGLKLMFHIPVHPVPTPEDLALALKNRVEATQVEFTNLYELQFRYKDPDLAAKFLTWDVETADSLVRAEALARLQSEIDYIDQELKTVTVEEHRRALGELLANLERQNMIVAGGGNYAAYVLQAPTISARPSVLGLLLQIASGVLAGIIISSAWSLLFPTRTLTLNQQLIRLFGGRRKVTRSRKRNDAPVMQRPPRAG